MSFQNSTMRYILTLTFFLLALCGADVAARSTAFDPGLTDRLSMELRKLAIKQSVAECRRWASVEDGEQRSRCFVRSLRYFARHNLLLAVMCVDAPYFSRCDGSIPSRIAGMERQRTVNMVQIWRTRDGLLVEGRLAVNEMQDEVEYGSLGIYTAPFGDFLYVPLRQSGNGGINLSQWFLLDGALTKIFDGDVVMRKDLLSRLPKKAQLIKGIWPDPASLRGISPVYKEGDANCCPDNGMARYTLELRDGLLRVSSVKYTRSRE